ncbi:YwqI/YxiC family protein [Priestia flexa]|uniref:YwqI/YxiC family protein n=1 Tax=Priestia flexa TaxID=86664 RepID=UPI00240D73F5|nr:YwqI/YxiC family protein [Priestia flexa]WEZ08545.1 YwqI/YxiC family protein [Priestia flexa]
MGQEIKVQYSYVEAVLKQLQTATQALDTSMPTEIGGDNVLDAVKVLNKINEALSGVLDAYQALLIQSTEMATNSVELWKETDMKLSNTMK